MFLTKRKSDDQPKCGSTYGAAFSCTFVQFFSTDAMTRAYPQINKV